jgi:hypothetical protein
MPTDKQRSAQQALSTSIDSNSGVTISSARTQSILASGTLANIAPGTRQVRRRSNKITDLEEAKVKLAALVASAPSGANWGGQPGSDQILSVAAFKAYLDERASHIASGDAAERAVELFTDYLASIINIEAPVAFWTPARQLELAKWCVEKHGHSAATSNTCSM